MPCYNEKATIREIVGRVQGVDLGGVELEIVIVDDGSKDGTRDILATMDGTGGVRDLHAALAGKIYVHAVTQLEISSTDLRNIITSGRDPRFLVPDAVREIILDTGCYARTRR